MISKRREKMKKIIVVFMLVGTLFLTGCSASEKKGVLVCTKKQDIDSSTKLESTYNVSYKNGYVTSIDTTETITSDKTEVLETYKTNLESVYNKYNDIKYYDNNIKIEGNQLISKTVVNYEKIDTDKLIEIDKNNAAAIEDGKVKVSTLKSAYEQLDATCKEK